MGEITIFQMGLPDAVISDNDATPVKVDTAATQRGHITFVAKGLHQQKPAFPCSSQWAGCAALCSKDTMQCKRSTMPPRKIPAPRQRCR